MDLSGDRAAQVGGEIESRAADFGLVDVAGERRAICVGLKHLAQATDSSGSEGLDRAGGDGVDPNIAAAKIGGQVAHGRFERSLGDSHYVVAWHDFLRAEVG